MYKVYGSAAFGGAPQESIHCRPHRGDKNVVVASTGDGERPVDTEWIKAASSSYRISSDISDYVFVAVPIVTLGIPNRNMQCFQYSEAVSWNADQGRMVYQTFSGKPLHHNHKNDDCRQAKGIILDSVLRFVPEYDLWKIVILTAWDRTKDPELVKYILTQPKCEYSMGAMVKKFIEFPTGKEVTPSAARGHVDDKGRLVYHECCSCTYFETSLIRMVEGAADCTAVNYNEEIIARPDELH